jgi:beta-phosphoglucomutase-like phosphatase (HAD superfamily)
MLVAHSLYFLSYSLLLTLSTPLVPFDLCGSPDIESLFSVVVDGIVSESLGLQGKPAPDIFTNCVEMLGFLPQESIMVEDATSGVKAGKAGGFGLVVGIDRCIAFLLIFSFFPHLNKNHQQVVRQEPAAAD